MNYIIADYKIYVIINHPSTSKRVLLAYHDLEYFKVKTSIILLFYYDNILNGQMNLLPLLMAMLLAVNLVLYIVANSLHVHVKTKISST